MSGFTYNGIHSSQFNVEYIPVAEDRWFAGPEYKLYEKDIEWMHGGYHYGNKVNIRKMDLKCYFEEITIAQREKIRKWLGRNTSGILILDDLPFVYFNVRPGAIVTGEIYNDNGKYSGTFTIPFVAHKPFGYLTRKYNTEWSPWDHAADYCGIIDQLYMPYNPTVSSYNFMVYNPGTEECGLTIRISGSAGKPIMFLNNSNGTSCILDSLPSNNLVLDIDGETGDVVTYAAGSPANFSNGYAYHDRGVVRLEPNESQDNLTYTYYGLNGTLHQFKLTGITPTRDMIGNRIILKDVDPVHYPGRSLVVIVEDINVSTGRFLCSEYYVHGEIPETGDAHMSSMNNIQILEKNDNGAWVTPTHLTMNSITIDYKPMLSL